MPQMSSIEILRRYLTESSVEERSAIWAEVRKLNIEGPSVSSYLAGLQAQFSKFNSAVSREKVAICDDIAHSDTYNMLINGIGMGSKLPSTVDVFNVESTTATCNESTPGECAYPLAA